MLMIVDIETWESRKGAGTWFWFLANDTSRSNWSETVETRQSFRAATSMKGHQWVLGSIARSCWLNFGFYNHHKTSWAFRPLQGFKRRLTLLSQLDSDIGGGLSIASRS